MFGLEQPLPACIEPARAARDAAHLAAAQLSALTSQTSLRPYSLAPSSSSGTLLGHLVVALGVHFWCPVPLASACRTAVPWAMEQPAA